MPRYIVTLTNEEMQELKSLIQKGGKGYRIKHAQILLKLDQKPENEAWTYDRIKDAYGASHSTIAGNCGQADPSGSCRLHYGQHHLRGHEKNEIKPWFVKKWCIPEADAEFVAKMEDVLEVY